MSFFWQNFVLTHLGVVRAVLNYVRALKANSSSGVVDLDHVIVVLQRSGQNFVSRRCLALHCHEAGAGGA